MKTTRKKAETTKTTKTKAKTTTRKTKKTSKNTRENTKTKPPSEISTVGRVYSEKISLTLELLEARKLLAEACESLPTSQLRPGWMHAANQHVKAMRAGEDISLHASLNARDTMDLLSEIVKLGPITIAQDEGYDFVEICFFCDEKKSVYGEIGDGVKHHVQCPFVRANLLLGNTDSVETKPITVNVDPPEKEPGLSDLLGAYLHGPSSH